MSRLSFALTSDGSKTIFNSEIGEHYHSLHGALQESRHVFVNSGLDFLINKHPIEECSILEVGFGTGLNFLLSADYCNSKQIHLKYTGLEAFPLPPGIISETGYDQYVPALLWQDFITNYEKALQAAVPLSKYYSLEIIPEKLMTYSGEAKFDILYFDAFAAIHQPDMWSMDSLSHITSFLRSGGVFVTYAITGNLKRNMKSLGFSIEKAPGAPGKREMLRAVKQT